jgi:hypothetical protein
MTSGRKVSHFNLEPKLYGTGRGSVANFFDFRWVR